MFATLSEDLQHLLLYSTAGGFGCGLIYLLVGCVCNPRSRRFSKHKSFIVPHDGNKSNNTCSPVQQVDIGGSSDLMCQSTELGANSSVSHLNTTPNSVVRSSVLSTDCIGQPNPVNRALPDIPATGGSSGGGGGGGDLSTDASGDNLASYADIVSNSANQVDSLYTTAQNDNGTDDSSSNHAYARIRDDRDNHFLDSSTENDTDDYGEARNVVVSVSTLTNSVPVSQSIITIQSNPGSSNIIPTMHHPPHILRLQITNNPIEGPVFYHPHHHHPHHRHHHHHHSHHHQSSSSSPPPPPPPLPLPLPDDRPQQVEQPSEISYNTISVREPLAKVLTAEPNDVGDVEHHYNEVEEERLSSFYEEINSGNSSTYYKINYENSFPGPSSTSGTRGQSSSNSSTINQTPMGVAFIDQNSGSKKAPLYSFIDKKNKRNKLPATPSNLYTMVSKPSTSKSGDHQLMNGNCSQKIERYSHPPPLPPPIHKDQNSSAQKSIYHRHTMFASMPGSLEENIYQKIALGDSEKDPGYETVDKDGTDDDLERSKMLDYGYEVVNNDECDPAYEIVQVSDPAYETIKNELDYGGSTSSHSGGDPNYEIIANPSSEQSSMYGVGLSVITPQTTHHSLDHSHSNMTSNSLSFYSTISNAPNSQHSNSIPHTVNSSLPSIPRSNISDHFRQNIQQQSSITSLPPPHVHSIIVNNNNNSSTNSSIIIDENVIIEHL